MAVEPFNTRFELSRYRLLRLYMIYFIHFFAFNFIFLKITPLGVILSGESIARIPEAWKCFPDPDPDIFTTSYYKLQIFFPTEIGSRPLTAGNSGWVNAFYSIFFIFDRAGVKLKSDVRVWCETLPIICYAGFSEKISLKMA